MNMGGIGQQMLQADMCSPMQQQTNIWTVASEMDRCLNRQQELVKELELRLNTVLKASAPRPSVNSRDNGSQSELRGRLSHHSETVQTANELLAELLERIDL